jgi:predicted transcriptional regulator
MNFSMKQIPRPSPLEIQVLRVLWQHGPSKVSTVHEVMDENKARAYTTVLSVLQNLEKKELVHRVKEGRAHVYEASYSADDILGEMFSELVISSFGGEWYDAMLQMIAVAQLTSMEKSDLAERLLASIKKHTTTRAKSSKKATQKSVKKVSTKNSTKSAKKRA